MRLSFFSRIASMEPRMMPTAENTSSTVWM